MGSGTHPPAALRHISQERESNGPRGKRGWCSAPISPGTCGRVSRGQRLQGRRRGRGAPGSARARLAQALPLQPLTALLRQRDVADDQQAVRLAQVVPLLALPPKRAQPRRVLHRTRGAKGGRQRVPRRFPAVSQPWSLLLLQPSSPLRLLLRMTVWMCNPKASTEVQCAPL